MKNLNLRRTVSFSLISCSISDRDESSQLHVNTQSTTQPQTQPTGHHMYRLSVTVIIVTINTGNNAELLDKITYSVSQKNPPLRFSEIFSQTVGNF